MRKKAQAAMEFLMTYGWAILVVLAAIGALAYLGILNPENWGQGRCFMTGDFNCQDWDIAADGTLQVTLLAGRDGEIADMTVGPSGCKGSSDITSCDASSATDAVVCDDGSSTYTLSSANMTVYGGQTYLCTISLGDNSGSNWNSGDKLDADIKVVYRLSGSQIEKTLTGEIKNIKVS